MEILIEHYRLGMKLSMPITIGDKTLLDADTTIDTEKTLDVIKSNGVKKLDVKKTYLRELCDKYPEFYSFKNDRLSKAMEKGTESRYLAAEGIVKARQLSPKPPSISILAKPKDLPDLEKVLVPYFSIELATTKWREINDKRNRSKVMVIWIDSFSEEERRTIKNDAKKNHPDLKIIAVYRQFYTGPFDSVKWLDNGVHLFNACFISAFPDKVEEFGVNNLTGVHLNHIKKPFIQLLSDGNFEDELSEWMTANSEIDVTCENIDESKFNPDSRFALVRVKNDNAKLPDIFNQLKNQGFGFMKMVVIPENINKEEIEGIKSLGRVFVMIGGIANPKLTALIDKIKA